MQTRSDRSNTDVQWGLKIQNHIEIPKLHYVSIFPQKTLSSIGQSQQYSLTPEIDILFKRLFLLAAHQVMNQLLLIDYACVGF